MAAVPFRSVPFRSVPFRSVPFRSVPFAAALVLTGLTPHEAHAIWHYYSQANTCHWPSAVQVISKEHEPYECSGVYLGDRVVATAAHCVFGADSHSGSDLPGAYIRFGEVVHGTNDEIRVDADCEVRGDFEVTSTTCGIYQDKTCYTGPDIAYCVLREHPSELGIAFGGSAGGSWLSGAVVMPVAPTGCERDWLYNRLYIPPFNVPDYDGALIGMGCEKVWIHEQVDEGSCSTATDSGTKRAPLGHLVHQSSVSSLTQTSGTPYSHGLGQSALEVWQPYPWATYSKNTNGPVRKGDSGSPLMVPMPDGTHRVIGVAAAIKSYWVASEGHYANFTYYTPLPTYLRWIEASSGRDVTPCHSWTSGIGWEWDGGCTTSAWHGSTTPSGKTWANGCFDLDSRVLPTQCGGAPPSEITPPPVLTWAGTSESELDWLIEEFVYGTSVPEGVLFTVGKVDELIGSQDDDILIGTPGGDIIRTGQGDDYLDGGRGGDSIFGGGGDDIIFGGPGDDRIHPGPGEDAVYAEAGDDVVVIFAGCEVGSNEILDGGPGNDTLLTGVHIEELWEKGVFPESFEQVVWVPALQQHATCDLSVGEEPEWIGRTGETSLQRMLGIISRPLRGIWETRR